MKGKITVTGANKLLLIICCLYVIFQVFLAFAAGILGIFLGEGYARDFLTNNSYLILTAIQFFVILLPCIIYISINKLEVKDVLRLNPIGILPAFMIFLMSFPAFLTGNMLNNIVYYFLSKLGDASYTGVPVPKTPIELVVGILVIAVSPAICEEIFNRGIMLSAYEKRGSMRAIVMTGILFGLFHFDIRNLLGPVFYGMLIGYYVIRTNSIFAGMLAHFLNNLLAELTQYFLIGKMDIEVETVQYTSADLFSAIIYGAVSMAALALLLMAFRKATKRRKSYIKPIASVKNDIVSFLSHWPLVIFIVVYLLINTLNVLVIMDLIPTL